ncbi:hypothetical protein UlMin_043821 [Ulmus minor]
MSASQLHEPEQRWQWENATASAIARFTTVAAMHPLDVVRTRFQVYDGRVSTLPTYKNIAHAIFTIDFTAGFSPAVLGSTVSWGLYFFFYDRAKQRYSTNREVKLSHGLHLAFAAVAGALLVKTRLQLQNPLHQTRPYSELYDAFRTIMREEGWLAIYKGIVPSLFLQVSHGAIQFTACKELHKLVIDLMSGKNTANSKGSDKVLNSFDYAALGASSKIAAILLSYPFQVIRARLQQWYSHEGIPRYMDSWHVVKETANTSVIRYNILLKTTVIVYIYYSVLCITVKKRYEK